MTPVPTVFVTSATGTVGGAVARQLRDIGWNVRTTTRSIASPAAQDLVRRGVQVTEGDWTNEAVLASAIAGSDFIFINLFPDFSDASRELQWTKDFLRIAKAAGVRHVVHSGILHTHTLPQFDPNHWASVWLLEKVKVEEAVTGTDIQYWTAIRPGYFMSNLLRPKVDFQFPGATATGVFALGMPPDTILPLVDHEDIAKFAVAAFRNPQAFHGKVIPLAGEMLSIGDAIGLLAKHSGRDIRGKYISPEESEKLYGDVAFSFTDPKSLAKFSLENQGRIVGFHVFVDMDEVKRWGISMNTFAGFLEREVEGLKDSFKSVKVAE